MAKHHTLKSSIILNFDIQHLWKPLTFIAPLIATLMIGCSNNIDSDADNTSSTKASFIFAPKTVSKGDVLTINLPAKHPSKLSILSPAGDWYIIHNPEDNVFLLPEQDFMSTEYLELPVATTKGLIWVGGSPKETNVFNQPGKYTVYIADNLETEPENTFHFMDTVTFK